MAIFGSFPSVRAQVAPSAQFAAAFAYAAEALRPGSAVQIRLGSLAVGASMQVELGEGAFAIEACYATKPPAEGFFESHRRVIDVQLVVAGEESMEVEDIARLTVSEAYDPGRDLVKYANSAGASRLTVRAGEAAVFFPTDGHRPSLQLAGPGLVRKTVVKVPVACAGSL